MYCILISPNPQNSRGTKQMKDNIVSLKLGYKSLYLYILLDIFYSEGGYEQAEIRRNKQNRGCSNGVHYGDKQHVLDYMGILAKIWVGNGGNMSQMIVFADVGRGRIYYYWSHGMHIYNFKEQGFREN